MRDGTRTVGAYDHVTDEWSPMPNMVEMNFDPGCATMRNKRFVVGSLRENGENGATPCEVFASACVMFVCMKQRLSSVSFGMGVLPITFSVGT